MQSPIWLTEKIVIAIHEQQMTEHGGLRGIRDLNLLSASLARLKHLFTYENEPSVYTLAAAYAFGIVKNHPFTDGNKRTGFLAAAIFLELNNAALDAPEMEVVVMMEKLAAGKETQALLAQWLENYSPESDGSVTS